MKNADRLNTTPKRFVLMFDDLRSIHLFKDVGQIPFQLHRLFGYDVEIVCRRNEETYMYLDEALQGLKVVFHEGHPYRYLAKHARRIDVLMLIHISTKNIYRGLFYKYLNPDGCLYVKTDMNGRRINYAEWGERNFLTQTKRVLLFGRLLKKLDIISFETADSFNGVSGISAAQKLLLPNGFDPSFIDWYNVQYRDFAEKDNIIMLVGRHGDYAKNTELMLDTLAELGDIGNWQVWFVGPRTEAFDRHCQQVLQRCPQLAGKIVCTGQVDDKRTLFQLYARAKVCCLTSRWEGFPNAAVEGLAFGNVLIMPDTFSSARDLTDNGRCGILVPDYLPVTWAGHLRRLMNEPDQLCRLAAAAAEHFESVYNWKRIIGSLHNKLQETIA